MCFPGLSALTLLNLSGNQLGSLPEEVFSGLTALQDLALQQNQLSSLHANVFSGLTALTRLNVSENGLTSLDARVFSSPTALKSIQLNGNNLTATALPGTVFRGLTALATLALEGNDLTSLPDGLFTGLTALTFLDLANNPDTGDTLALTVTVEKVGTDQVRAKVPAGAPFAVDFTPAVVNGSLPSGVTKLAVAAGSVAGTAVTVTRTSGTTAPVTVDIDLTTQPTLPANHVGYTFAKATGSTPVEIPEAKEVTRPQPKTTNFYLWRTTITVGSLELPSVRLLSQGYFSGGGNDFGSINEGATFGFPPWNPPHKHHVDRDGYISVAGIWVDENTDTGAKKSSGEYTAAARHWGRHALDRPQEVSVKLRII